MTLKLLKPRVATLEPRVKTAGSTGSWRAGKTTNDRGYTYQWQKARERFLHVNPLCKYCREREGRITAASIVDHVVPHRGDQELFWNEANWAPLCKPCHDSVKQSEEKAAQSCSG